VIRPLTSQFVRDNFRYLSRCFLCPPSQGGRGLKGRRGFPSRQIPLACFERSRTKGLWKTSISRTTNLHKSLLLTSPLPKKTPPTLLPSKKLFVDNFSLSTPQLAFPKIFLQGLLQANFSKIFSFNDKKCLTWNLKSICL
jgi:hypothetical protein